MLAIYATTIFLSAALLFVIQPLFARLALPLLGGTPAVWNTCMVFFQATLLLGYLYAHLTTKWLGARKQAVLHLVLLGLPLLVLPIAIPADCTPPTDANPVGWLLALLAVSVGLPFFVVSATNPLLQKWFSASGHPASHDPYFLYAASNFGSMAALVAYPLAMEPSLRLVQQTSCWTIGYGLLATFIVGCAVLLWSRRSVPVTPTATPDESESLPFGRRARWVLLSFIPSSLMLGVTTHITTDIASFPLMWIIPLGLYLLTFVFAFARRQVLSQAVLVRWLPLLAIALAVTLPASATRNGLWFLVGLNVVGFFVGAMVCHGELAKDRPRAAHLTEFYLWMSVGGVLGGLFNACLAPSLFTKVAEYPLAIVLACLVLPKRHPQSAEPRDGRLLDWALPAGLVIGVACLAFSYAGGEHVWGNFALLGVPAIICYTFVERPLRFGLGIGAMMLSGFFCTLFHSEELYAARSFFAVNRVQVDSTGQFRQFVQGSTVHGWQRLDPARAREPMAYYHRQGPLGKLFAQFGPNELPRVAGIGLGCGVLTAYETPERHFTFYEIDPEVQRIAENRSYFTFLHASQGKYEIVLGDGRLKLRTTPDRHFDLLVLDAFSSDAIPAHLLTIEALDLYLAKLAERGVLAFHVSNRFVNLEPVLADLAASRDLVCLSCLDDAITPADKEAGKAASHYVMLARTKADLRGLGEHPGWRWVGPSGRGVWTDDYWNVLGVMRW